MDMKNTYTTGPWSYIAPGDNAEETPGVIYAGDKFIAQVDDEFDARLIASAPCLLERLEGLMHRLETIRETDKTGLALDADIQSARDVIRRAILGQNADPLP